MWLQTTTWRGIPAQSDALTTTDWQLTWPESTGDWVLLVCFGLAVVYTAWICYRDTKTLSRGWTLWLAGLRVVLLAVLAVIALNPQERIQKAAYRPSHVALLVDTSTSMQQSETDPRDTGAQAPKTRAEAVAALLADSNLIAELQKAHNVDVYTFNSDLSENLHRFRTDYLPERLRPDTVSDDAATEPAPVPDWNEFLRASGASTRLGDSVDKLLAETADATLSGVVVFTDGASNVGRGVDAANERAKSDGVRLVAVGVGGTQPPLNLQVVKLVAPTDVQLPTGDDAGDGQDTFDVTAFVQSEGLGGRIARVTLQRKADADSAPEVIDSQDITLPEGSEPTTVTFQQTADRAGNVEYIVEVEAPPGVIESRDDDNQQSQTINVFDEPLRVLIVAGGPMRDYRFAKNALNRHKSMEVDIWLQTGTVGISQDAHEILYEFPATREELFRYDVVMAFDPDWSQIPDESQVMLEDWVSSEGGGLVLIAGDVYTPQLAAAISEEDEGYHAIAALYPVLLEEVRYQIGRAERADQPWKLGLTQEGKAASFLRVQGQSDPVDVWEEFEGVFRCYPTRGRKGGTTVYAEFTNPLSSGSDGQPVLLAGQRYSQGNTLYLGSPEIWRLRSLSEEYYDRFWINLVRKAADGRTKRGLQRATLILEGTEYSVGQTVPVRARVLSPQFEPLESDRVTIEVYDPDGRTMVPPPILDRDRNRPSEYVGDFLALKPGRYKIELPVPDSNESLAADLRVSLPALEMSSLIQNVGALEQLVDGTGGSYLTIADAAARIPALLPNRGQEAVIDQQLRELWDHWAVMCVLAGLLAVEWLTRKLLKLA